ncbi:HisA/HisF-related TIM barrel protein [Candidatus Persebacteraceae bacterium Df01]|jgi:phosphoribosylformimino-5-aminoimidazole carboxamide ribotide isomerase|uniref:1-(5-phosphoribosyl)-5-[(5-phosphoribosylamino)methylideneamino] imidazole-4-carboxamide isomerase n=1 Tax=Candidatus Doriopsillibacter californiensis TaxID=2970740 RepID=A0ABT7QJK5_9GAMM|nr:HisA/HisF-related TIM barrel protein [Candidatus Persebacteraceae bacterium Df01]
MQIIPAIDILNGQCVRLRRGDYNSASIFGDDPGIMARHFFDAGVRRLHVVDLDAAKAGASDNSDAIAAILHVAADYDAVVQVGGGVRSLESARQLLNIGASYVIVGTAAVRDAVFRAEVIAAFPQQVILGLDVRDDKVAVAGWLEESPFTVDDLFDSVRDAPPAAVVFTDIGRDGMMRGVNAKKTGQVAAKAPCGVIASGGVCGVEDLQALTAADSNIVGAIIGRAVYENFSVLEKLLENYA